MLSHDQCEALLFGIQQEWITEDEAKELFRRYVGIGTQYQYGGLGSLGSGFAYPYTLDETNKLMEDTYQKALKQEAANAKAAACQQSRDCSNNIVRFPDA